MATVRRYDATTLGKTSRTPQGFLRAPAFLTRAGIFKYRRADGSIVRELRPPEEVFKAESLATLSAAPVTDLHPSQPVSPTNVRALSVGHVGEQVRQDDDKVSAELVIEHADTIAAVERGDRRELSCGYQCRIDETPGEWNGQPYDCIQRDVVYNHVAIGPRGWGRAGAEVALRLDSGDAVISTVVVAQPQQPKPQPPRKKDRIMDVTIRIDGVDVTMPAASAKIVEEKINTLALQRIGLIEKASRMLPAGFRFDALSEREIMIAALTGRESIEALKSKDDSYVAARFDAEHANLARTNGLGAARNALNPHGSRIAPPAPRHDAAPYVPEWLRPTSTHRTADGIIKVNSW